MGIPFKDNVLKRGQVQYATCWAWETTEKAKLRVLQPVLGVGGGGVAERAKRWNRKLRGRKKRHRRKKIKERNVGLHRRVSQGHNLQEVYVASLTSKAMFLAPVCSFPITALLF